MNESDMTNSELKIYFDGRFDTVEKDLNDVKVRLEKIENEIHDLGNGKAGIAFRVDRLEKEMKIAKENKENAKESKKNWIGWIIALAAALLGSLLGPLFASWF